MPGFDGTGPLGQGSATGRGLGVCGYGRGVRGFGRGFGRGLGRGYGRGLGRGFGPGYGFYQTPNVDGKTLLDEEIKYLEQTKSQLEKRRAELDD